MMRAVALLLLLAACGGPSAPPSALSVEEASCARQANDAPAVREMLLKAAGSAGYARNNEDAIKVAKQDATVACLRARGVIRGGGVERQRP